MCDGETRDPQLPARRRHRVDARRGAALGAEVDERTGGAVATSCCAASACAAPRRGRTIDVGNAGTLLRLLPGWLAGQGSGTLDARRRREHPPAAGRPRRRAAARRWARRVECRDGRLPPLVVEGARAARDPLRAAGRERAGEVVRAARGAARRRGDDGGRAAADARPHRADAAPRPARRSTASDGARSTRPVGASGSSSSEVDGAGRLLLGGVLHRRRDARARLRAACSRGVGVNPTRTGLLRRAGADGRRRRGRRARGARAASRSPTSSVRARRARGDDRRARAEVPLLIDELPLVALLGAFAEGETVVRGRGGAAPQGVGPDRDGRRGPARRSARGSRRRRTASSCEGDGRAARRHARRGRRPPARDARRGRRARVARGRRGRGLRGGGGLLSGLPRTTSASSRTRVARRLDSSRSAQAARPGRLARAARCLPAPPPRRAGRRGVVLLLVLVGWLVAPAAAAAASAEPQPRELPRGGREILPRNRVVAYYGAPQDAELGVLGIGTARAGGAQAARAGARLRAPGPAGAAGLRADRDARAGRPGRRRAAPRCARPTR